MKKYVNIEAVIDIKNGRMPIELQTYTPYSELPSYISAMYSIVPFNANKKRYTYALYVQVVLTHFI